jgi:hypothetical protein
MYDSERYRCIAVDCLNAARRAPDPHYKGLYLFMAQSWVTLANQDDATDELMASWAAVDPITADSDGVVLRSAFSVQQHA